MFKHTVSLLVFAFALNTFAYSQNGQFPQGPDATLTPGELCQHADSYRYPEKVAYCERDVSSDTKRGLFVKYDQLGFRTREMNRGSFKIDHYIPLCMGGSNSEKNLWPQYVTVYNITDPMEPLLCEKMASGRLTQQKAVEYIKYGKAHLDEVSKIISEVNRL
ncbi:MAG: hypothetical protein H7326_02070 [Bdellovibrionaceae bacterium]|nr:hypothetical protein [Pseudobdellovibrionaceae bacterium]